MKGLNKQYNLVSYQITQEDYHSSITLPVLLYKGILDLPWFMPTRLIKSIFSRNHWLYFGLGGIITDNHFHSKTHEVLGFYKGKTVLGMGGKQGETIAVEKGDVLVIPAGIVYQNLGDENQIKCVGAYSNGREHDVVFASTVELQLAEKEIKKVPVPREDPVLGHHHGGLTSLWIKKEGSPNG